MAHQAVVRGIGASVEQEGYGAPAVVLEARDEIVPIFVSPDQAHSIQYALSEEPTERPLTHDLLLEMLTDFGGAIDGVRIDDIQDGTFYAKIDAERYEAGDRERFVFDARPSDGIAIAVRTECPIEVADDVIDEAGMSPESLESGDGPDDFEFDDPAESGQ